MSEQEYYHKDEITLKELFIKIGDFTCEIKKQWKLVLTISLIFTGLFVLNSWLTPKVYPAKLTFMLDEEGGGGGGGLSLLGDFGLGGQAVNVNRMIDIANSRKILTKVLFKKVDIGNKSDFIANHIIRVVNLHDDWEDSKKLNSFLFTNPEIDSFGIAENLALKSIHTRFTKQSGGIMTLVRDELSGILTLTITTQNANLSLKTSLVFYEELQNYYVKKSITKEQESYDLLKNRTDSIQIVMDEKQRALLRFEDRNRGLGLREYENRRYRLEGELRTLSLTFAETYKRFQIAEYNLQNDKPFISAIDKPILPLYPAPNSKLKAGILGAITGLFLVLFFIISRKFYQDVME